MATPKEGRVGAFTTAATGRGDLRSCDVVEETSRGWWGSKIDIEQRRSGKPTLGLCRSNVVFDCAKRSNDEEAVGGGGNNGRVGQDDEEGSA